MVQGDKRTVVVLSPGDFVLSEDAEAFRSQPADVGRGVAMIEDIYSIQAPRRWYVVHTLPQREERAARALTALGATVFLPHTVDWRPRSRVQRDQGKPSVPLVKPLLSRYLFADLPAADRAWGRVYGLDGVQRILSDSRGPVHVPTLLVDVLRDRELAGDFNKTIKRGRVVSPVWAREGVRAQITDGPFAQFWATIRRVLPRDRVEVVVNIFNSENAATMDLAQLRKPC